MNTAQRLMEIFARGGVEVCFANPGTSETHLVSALDRTPQVRPVLALFEGVATGAADGYGRMAQKPALTLLHLGPGLANGLANLHNAWRAHTPLVSLVGEHATFHRANDAPLQSDIAAIARPVSCWVETAERAADAPRLAAEALDAARNRGPATLILPADVTWSDEAPAAAERPRSGAGPNEPPGWEAGLDAAAEALRSGGSALLIGGRRLTARACAAAERIAAATGATVLTETFPPRIARGGGTRLQRLPYVVEMAVNALSQAQTLVLAGARAPVAFFALPGRPVRLTAEGTRILELARPTDDIEAVLEALAEALGAKRAEAAAADPPPPEAARADAALDPDGLARVMAASLPEGAIVSDESITLGHYAFDYAARARPHDWLTLTGGAIGQGLPVATGAALACPDRPVIALEGDGSALYTIQALWTQAREGLHVVNVILSNGRYAILDIEMMRMGAESGDAARALFDLRRPGVDFTRIAEGFGVPASRARTTHELAAALSRALAEPGPHLIEAVFQ